MTKQYNQLTYEQRCQIYVLNKSGLSQRETASAVGVSQSTISRELARNRGDRGYRFQQAHIKAAERRQKAVKRTKMTPEAITSIESKIRLEWSPEQISGWLLEDQGQLISHESIYLHIWADKRAGGNLYTYLRRPQGSDGWRVQWLRKTVIARLDFRRSDKLETTEKA